MVDYWICPDPSPLSVWAEQGDDISVEYAGTHALKGDLVR